MAGGHDGDGLRDARVLIVDGNGLTRTLTRRALEEAGAAVEESPDGAGALRLLGEGAIHVVVTGREPHGLDGIALVRAIRADTAHADVHVIVLTSTGSPEAIVEALSAGADDHLLKPFHPAELVARVRAGMRLVRAREDMRRQRDGITGLMDAIRDGLVVSDPDGVIVRVNPRMQELIGLGAGDLIGAGPPYPFADVTTSARLTEVLRRVPERGGTELDVELVRRDGTRFPAALALSRSPGAVGGEGPGAIWLVKDLTRRRREQARLRESESRFAAAADAAPVMMFICDPSLRVTFANAEMRAFLDIPEASPDAPVVAWHLIHPDDQARLLATAASVRPGDVLEAEVRLLRHDGLWRWVSTAARMRVDAEGRREGFVGTATDVTDARLVQEEQEALHAVTGMVAAQASADEVLARVASAVGRLLQADAGGVVRFEGDGARLVGSWARVDALRREVGSPIPVEGDGVTARIHRTGRPARQDDYGEGAGRRSSVGAPVVVEGRLWGAIGAVHTHANMLPPDAEERLERFAEVVGLAVANAEARERLAHLAATDPLTGLPNRRTFDASFARAVARAQRDATPLSLAVADIDHFKSVNDTHGHDAGDRVLVEVAAVLSAATRVEDPVARFGGEEFVWLMPGAGAEPATAVAERVRRGVASARITRVGSLTMSLGVATLRPGESPDPLFKAADDALFVAKQSGRNRVVHADGIAVAGVWAVAG